MKESSYQKDIEWLKKLNDELWKTVYSRYPRRVGHRTISKKIVRKEVNNIISNYKLKKVFKIIEKHKLNFLLHNACMGFGIGLTVYENELYPGVEQEKVLVITNNHLSEKARFEDGWKTFYPFVKKNEHLSFEPLKNKSYYDY